MGASLDDVRHLLLTHVHLDHAGGAGHLAARLPDATVHAHEDGARHLVAPERLVASTRRTFGDAHDRLWGEVRPIPAHRIRGWRPEARSEPDGIRGLATPGHIDHHVAWIDEREGTLFAGDALGIVLHPDAATHPATPPPGVDLEAWSDTLDLLASVGADRVAVAHVGLHGDVAGRIRSMREALDALVGRVRVALRKAVTEEDAGAWEEEVRERLARHRPREEVDRYFEVFRAATDYAGVARAIGRGRGPQGPQGA